MTTPDYDVAIIGTGFSGLGMAIRLKQQGDENFIIFERNDDVGGTWYMNHYPGCACDVQSHLYSFSFEPNPNWSRMFSPQAEIQAYLARCADKYRLRDKTRFNSNVEKMHFDEGTGLWTIRPEGGKPVTARFVVCGLGPLTRPSFPDIPGLDSFEGKAFHSQHWDHDHDLRGKRVAVIGTGASAIQFVPQIAPEVQQLDLYQRTPPWIIPKPDRRISGIEKRLFRLIPGLQRAWRRAIYWSLESRVLAFVITPKLMKAFQMVGQWHIRRNIRDPELRRKVTPDYTIGCKRVLISDDYYPALDRDNVDVITSGIREIRPRGVVTEDGVEHPCDTLIFGTGFQATEPLPRNMVFGRGGRDILDAWRDGIEAYKGTTVSGFPNLFILTGPNTGLGHSSMVFMIESQIQYVLDALSILRREGLKFVDADAEVQREYNEALQARMAGTVWETGGCRSWYMDENGKNVSLWPGFTWQFRLQTRRFDTAAYELCHLDDSSDNAADLDLRAA